MQSNIEKIVEAVTYIENEGLKLRDEAKAARKTPELYRELSEKKQEVYSLKESFLEVASKQKLLVTTGYVAQKVGKFKAKLYQNKVVGDSSETLITSFKPCKASKDCRNNKLGDIGLMSYRELETDLDFETAMEIVRGYVEENKSLISKAKTAKSAPKTEKKKYDIKETKSVSLEKLRVVKDIHVESSLNREKYAEKKSELERLISENKGKYPKSEAIVVKKTKDPEDRRRVVYEIEDGFRRFVISKELGLAEVQVGIIEE